MSHVAHNTQQSSAAAPVPQSSTPFLAAPSAPPPSAHHTGLYAFLAASRWACLFVRSLQGVGNKAAGNKPELRALLTERFGSISRDEFAAISATVQRSLAVAMLPGRLRPHRQRSHSPQSLPAPEQPLALLPPVDDGAERISARLTRRRA